jgi:hypothetical protein
MKRDFGKCLLASDSALSNEAEGNLRLKEVQEDICVSLQCNVRSEVIAGMTSRMSNCFSCTMTLDQRSAAT